MYIIIIIYVVITFLGGNEAHMLLHLVPWCKLVVVHVCCLRKLITYPICSVDIIPSPRDFYYEMSAGSSIFH